MKIGEYIRKIRKQKGLNQAELAQRAGVGNTHISDVELGRADPSLKLLFNISNSLDIKMEDIFLHSKYEPSGKNLSKKKVS